MNLLDPRAPLIAGSVVVLGLAAFLTAFSPMPGELASPHGDIAGIPTLASCGECHASGGLAEGCLGCHEEIAAQLRAKAGYHHFLLDGREVECARCHTDHLGAAFPLVNELSWEGQDPEAFRHPHVEYSLSGAHDGLGCRTCHATRFAGEFSRVDTPARTRPASFLGLRQECVACHEDIHSGGLSTDCESCHDQGAFRPASGFDHGEHFPLEGGHERTDCEGCHVIPDTASGASVAARALPFDHVRGTRCEECHPSPHRAVLAGAVSAEGCESCHPPNAPPWADARESITHAAHADLGFRLDAPHDAVECAACHDPELAYEERFPDPRSPGYARSEDTCHGCHADVHAGQFAAKYASCLDCHARAHFAPSLVDVERHAGFFELTGKHESAECAECHREDAETKVREFVRTTRECSGCHADVHAGQFAGRHETCAACHGTEHFAPADFGLARHEDVFLLAGAHGAVPCVACHAVDAATDVRQFRGLGRECKSCHADPHGDQFARELDTGDCTACHSAACETFTIRQYDHAAQTGYALEGAHAGAACADCHRVETERSDALFQAEEAAGIRRFRPTDTACASCHRDAHRGQFGAGENARCDRCHTSSQEWSEIAFDHAVDSRFALDGVHSGLSCASCHPQVRLPDGSRVTQYKPLGTECEDCHAVVPR